MDAAQKVKAIRKAKGLSQDKFAEPLGIKGGQISAIEKGRVQPSGSVVELLFARYLVNMAWWERGAGEMFLNRPPQVDDSVFSPEDLEMFKLIVDEPELHLSARYLVQIRKEMRKKALRSIMDLADSDKPD